MKEILLLQKIEKEEPKNQELPAMNYQSHLSWFGCPLATHSHGCVN